MRQRREPCMSFRCRHVVFEEDRDLLDVRVGGVTPQTFDELLGAGRSRVIVKTNKQVHEFTCRGRIRPEFFALAASNRAEFPLSTMTSSLFRIILREKTSDRVRRKLSAIEGRHDAREQRQIAFRQHELKFQPRPEWSNLPFQKPNSTRIKLKPRTAGLDRSAFHFFKNVRRRRSPHRPSGLGSNRRDSPPA